MPETAARAYICHVNDNVPAEKVYIGRAAPRRGLPASVFANPFKLPAKPTPSDRNQVLLEYRNYLRSSEQGAKALRELPTLRGKALACWCRHAGQGITPARRCHGDVLVELLREMTDAEMVAMADQIEATL